MSLLEVTCLQINFGAFASVRCRSSLANCSLKVYLLIVLERLLAHGYKTSGNFHWLNLEKDFLGSILLYM